jgi:anaphase-promoting complex subunit 3
MAPLPAANPTVTGLLRQAIYYHLDHASYENALFFAERLTAQDSKSSESAYLLALSHLRLGDFRSTYEVSKASGYGGKNLGSAWVFAQACLALERYKDGITALEKTKGLWAQKSNLGRHTACTRAPYPDAAAVSCLLGQLYRAYDDKKKAISCFEDALKINPFMWNAFTALCDMGVNVRVPNIFKATDSLAQQFEPNSSTISPEPLDSTGPQATDVVAKKPASRNVLDISDPFELQRSSTYQDMPFSSNLFSMETEENDFMSKIAAARSRLAVSNGAHSGPDGMETPTGPTAIADAQVNRPAQSHEPPQAPARKPRQVQPIDASLLDAPPRMSYRLGTKRNTRVQERAQESVELLSDASAGTGALRSSIPAVERKRTVSGHPVQSRPTAIEEAGAPQRRSARLNMFKPSIKANSGAATIGATATRELKKARPPISRIMRPGSSGSSVGRVVSGNRKPLEDHGMDLDHAESSRIKEAPAQIPMQKQAELETVKIEEALKEILQLLKKLGMGYYYLSQFQCPEALQTYNSLPAAQRDTPWVLAQMGRAHYEQLAWADAEKCFRRLRVLAPARLEDMEVYSTILWFLKREADLSFLAHELVDSAWHSPQAWCALGNAWSLANDHEQALRCFKRATQLNPKFAYAFTLQGHEHVANEEYEKALTAYRMAISADRRHYNAYYGIGRVYEKLGNYDKAYTHFHTASVINPTNAVLICCIGTALEKQKQIIPALQFFSKATELAPKAAQTRFRKARALLALGQLEAAQKELMILKDLAPDEAGVHFLLGKLYRSINEKQLAVRHFTYALALDPKVRIPPLANVYPYIPTNSIYSPAKLSSIQLKALRMTSRWTTQ